MSADRTVITLRALPSSVTSNTTRTGRFSVNCKVRMIHQKRANLHLHVKHSDGNDIGLGVRHRQIFSTSLFVIQCHFENKVWDQWQVEERTRLEAVLISGSACRKYTPTRSTDTGATSRQPSTFTTTW